jgi:glycosyltransferase involved in cell wall biosynthesis
MGGKILFLGHDASRSGAPLLLLEFISWLKKNSGLQMELLLKSGGPLESAYSKHVQTDIWYDKIRQYNFGFLRSWLRRARLTKWQEPDWNTLYPVEEYPLVYANTVLTLEEAIRFACPKRKIILHVHELEQIVKEYGIRKILEESLDKVALFIAASGAVEEFLVMKAGIPHSKVRRIYEFAVWSPKPGVERIEARTNYGLAEDDFAIGMCGSIGWRKGTDLFIRLAQIIKKRDKTSKCRLVWLGGSEACHGQAMHDVESLGISDICRFYPHQDDTSGYYVALDLFVLTSREDPFPVAMLEAASAGLPIICFKRSGGAPEFVQSDAGFCVPYADVEEMADVCLGLMEDRSRREQLGIIAKEKLNLYYTVQTQAPKLMEVIQGLYAAK